MTVYYLSFMYYIYDPVFLVPTPLASIWYGQIKPCMPHSHLYCPHTALSPML